MATIGNPQAVREYPTLTALAQGYSNNEFIGFSLLPLVEREELFLKIPVYGPETLKVYDTLRGMYGDSNVVLSKDKKFILVELKEHDLAFPIDLQYTPNAELAQTRRYNTKLAQEGILLGLEKYIADTCQNPANYLEANRLALTGTQLWSDYENSDPVDDVDVMKSAVRVMTGKKPNIVAMGEIVFEKLKKHPRVMTTNLLKQPVYATPETLAEHFSVKEVKIGQAVKADDKNVMTDLWGNTVIVAYVSQPLPGNTERNVNDMSLGYTIRRKGYPKVDEFELNPGKVIAIRNTDTLECVITSNICGAIITNVVA